MSLDERRAAIVAATLPLLPEHGANVTTKQIATAAGIAEGTVFRAFKDKQELLTTCLEVAMRADAEVDQITRIPTSTPLTERLAEATDAVSGYLDRLWSLMQTMHRSGFDPRREHEAEGSRKGPREQMQRVSTAIAELLAPEADSLRLTPDLTARLLLGLVFTNRMQGKGFGDEADDAAEPAQLVEVFLHGALNSTGGRKK
ncbi:TetR/AcrR family transcriptional regulator [Solihabitans fulvus]|uniref:TetR/AcrR family transcriptional regulator n=2 Tax=Solihabitans fulvus TaxID=1892852 RepID=A0A5B2XNF5_9PSEU|nr:TetR/AcrR family transcriptional regulator [Solihabitans fulvus]